MLKLAGIVINANKEEKDMVGWMDARSSNFTVKSVYDMLTRRNTNEVWKGWKRIWSLRIQECAKVFM